MFLLLTSIRTKTKGMCLMVTRVWKADVKIAFNLALRTVLPITRFFSVPAFVLLHFDINWSLSFSWPTPCRLFKEQTLLFCKLEVYLVEQWESKKNSHFRRNKQVKSCPFVPWTIPILLNHSSFRSLSFPSLYRSCPATPVPLYFMPFYLSFDSAPFVLVLFVRSSHARSCGKILPSWQNKIVE